MSRQNPHPPNPGGPSGHMYYSDSQHPGGDASGSSMYHHPAPQAGYYDPRMYEQPPPGSSGGIGPYGYSAPVGSSGSSRSPLPPLASRDLYGGYPPPSPHMPRASPGGQPPLTPRGLGEPWLHPAAVPRQESRNVSVKLEDLVSHDRGYGAGKGSGFTSLPLGASQEPRPASQGQSRDGAVGAAADPPVQAGPSDFIKKLYKMLEEESAQYGKNQGRGSNTPRGSVGWGRGGISFVVWDMNDFTTKVLPQTFRHSNFSSFVRQLNKYGFSKIKHVDDDTGQIKENIWEFQHPNFVAGGKADLDFIKRKAVASKKTEVETENSPAARPAFGTSGEDNARLAEMEQRICGMEDRLANALEDVRQARHREQGSLGLMREMLSHLSAAERGTVASDAGVDADPSPRMLHMWRLYEHLASGNSAPVQPPFGYSGFQPPPHSYPAYTAPPHLAANTGTQVSPQTDGSRRSDSNAPATSRSSATNRAISGTAGNIDEREMSEGQPANFQLHQQQVYPQQTPLPPAAPGFAETPAWLTQGVTAQMPMYHRKSSEGMAMRLMMEALASQRNGSGAEFVPDGQDPLDPSPPSSREPSSTGAAPSDQRPEETANRNVPIIQSSPFGTLLIPSESSVHPNAQKAGRKGGKKAADSAGIPFSERQTTDANGNAVRTRRSTIIKPHWNKTPNILVVEDDVVYRQLSSKFLEKFGCVVETVENASAAIAKMNATKYDLVLMDIFFGPSMDGRKATSLIRQFDMYTPIISMTSNAQPQDVDSYLQSGMNDILAKPFTKHGLFGILDKHLLHMKSLQLSAEVPRGVGVPPLSDQGVLQAVATGAASVNEVDWNDPDMRNPLAAMGWSDDTYQIVLAQYLQTGTMPDMTHIDLYQGQPLITNTTFQHESGAMNGQNGIPGGGGTIGPNMVFGDFHNRKRSLETATDDGWSPMPGTAVETGRIEEVAGQDGAGGPGKVKRAKR